MNRHLEHFLALPLTADLEWHGAVLSTAELLSGLTAEVMEDASNSTAFLALWCCQETGATLLESGEHAHDRWEVMVATLTAFAENECHAARPALLSINDRRLADRLSKELAGSGTTVKYCSDSPAVARVVELLMDRFAELAIGAPPSLDEIGCSSALMRDYANAAAAFYRRRIWLEVGQNDLFHVDKPTSPRKLKYFTLLGSGGSEFGVGLYAKDQTHWLMAAGQFDIYKHSIASFTFDSELASAQDHQLWQELNLPLETDEAFPYLSIINRGEPQMADPQDIRFMTVLLGALAATTEAELDSGQWEKWVEVEGKRKKCVLSMPDLLSPPTRQQWLERGVEPDARCVERVNSLMHKEIGAHPGMIAEELDELMKSKFVGRRVDEFELPTDTPYQRADKLYYEALECHGRRRLQLARQAIAEAPEHLGATVPYVRHRKAHRPSRTRMRSLA